MLPIPLDAAGLQALALRQAARYATTRARLAAYLDRKIAERGWEGPDAPPVAALVERMGALGYVDDAAFAATRAAALQRRGYGARRIRAALQQAGIDPQLQAEAGTLSREEALESALAMVRRRRFGGVAREDPRYAKQLAALIRAGHDYETARAALADRGD